MPGVITDTDIDDFQRAFKSAPGPILAYCRSGMRSTSLWALAEAELLDVDAIMATALAAGFDLKGLRPRMDAVAAAKE